MKNTMYYKVISLTVGLTRYCCNFYPFNSSELFEYALLITCLFADCEIPRVFAVHQITSRRTHRAHSGGVTRSERGRNSFQGPLQEFQ